MKIKSSGRVRLGIGGAAALLMGLALVAGGCSAARTVSKVTKDAARKVTRSASSGDAQKKVGLALFVNKTPLGGEEMSRGFRGRITRTMQEECPDTLLLELPAVASGAIDNMALSRTGRRMGLNTVVTGALIDISAGQEERGILWFREVENYIQTLLIVSAYDIETGAKLFDESFREEVEVEEFDPRMITADSPAVTEALTDIAERMGEGLCEALEESPWRGFITAVDGNRVTISSGSEVGLKTGMVLDALDNSRTMEGMGGQLYFVPGKVSGQIRLTEVAPARSRGEIISGQVVPAGNSVRLPE